ncbi:MAG TPA: Ig-like domain repeat protein, partial [Gemmatales bacterium]|nr:Ig-like domain repeat protein [Gemmatales bacterium]
MVALWLRSWFSPSTTPAIRRSARRALEFDTLEDRLAPATLTWTGAAGGLWSDANNWLNESALPQAPTVGDDLIFPTGPATLNSFNDLAAGTAIRSITFTGAGAAYVLGGNSLVIGDNDGGGIFHNVSGAATVTINFVSLTLASGTAKTFDVVNAAAHMTFSTTINLNGTDANFGQAGSAGLINTILAINGSGDITKAGTGIFIVAGPNTYSGTTFLNGGTIQIGASNVIPDNSPFIMAAGTTLDLANFSETLGSLSGPVGATITLGTGTLTVGSLNSDTTFGGLITGTGGLVKTGSGNLTLTGSNTYSGATLISQGILEVNGMLASNVTISAGGTLAGDGAVANTTVNLGGQIAPGTTLNPGILVAQITAFQAGSNLFVRLNGLNPGEADRLVTGASSLDLGDATLSGTLGFAAALGDSFTIITANGITGTFASGAVAFIGGRKFAVAYNANSVVVTRIIANSVTTVSSSQNPAILGDSVTFTATVVGETGTTGAPTGTVEFYADGNLIGTGTLDEFGQATFTTDTLALGSHTITAVYVGDGDYEGSTSGDLVQNIIAAPIGSILIFAGSPQSTVVNTAFGINLQARVLDTNGDPVAGVLVTFTAPQSATLATGTFVGQVAIATAITDANGVATAPVLTANTVAGDFFGVGTLRGFPGHLSLA